MPTTVNRRSYDDLKLWLAQPSGQAGLARLRSLGVTWDRQARVDLIVEGMGGLEAAPPLPPVRTFQDKAAFLAGSAWILALIANRSKHQP